MIYVMSDIHGNMRRFNSILKQIDLQPEDTLYILGDVIDRHPDGIRILRKIIEMPNVKMILGNHEYMMLQALGECFDDYPFYDGEPCHRFGLWYRNGGEVTHRHWKHLKKALRREIADYLKALPLNYDIDVNGIHYKLVHGAPVELYEQVDTRYPNATHFAVWKRWRVFKQLPNEYTLIFGHTTTNHYQNTEPLKIWRQPHLIGIDCGSGYPDERCCYYGNGRLACLRLDDMKEFYSEENYDQ